MPDNPYRDPMGSVKRRAEYEYHLAFDCILPLMRQWGIEVQSRQVLDLGCGGGGLAVALAESGAHCLGIDHNAQRIAQASNMAAQHGVEAQFLMADILKIDHVEERFDLIILSEVVEHLVTLSNIQALFCWCREHLAESGKLYVSFPPWYGPFAGHQAGWPGIRYLPWYPLVPDRLKRLLVPNHAPRYIGFIRELNRLTISTFEHIVEQVGLFIVRQESFLLRPEFYWRYKAPVLQSTKIRMIREVMTTGAFYLITGRQFGQVQSCASHIKRVSMK